MDVLFYDKNLRETYPNKVMLFQQMARVGRTDNMEGDSLLDHVKEAETTACRGI